MNKRFLEKVLLATDLIVMAIIILCTLTTVNVNASTKKSKSQIKIEKHIKSYAKKKHKAKGVRFVGERGATKNVLKYAKKNYKKKKNKKLRKYGKYYKKDVCERFTCTIIDEYGAYITGKGYGGVIDGEKDDWKIGTKIIKYNLYNWKSGKYSTWFYAYK